MDSRLDQLAPDLAAVLHAADDRRLRRAAEVACSLALAASGLREPRADAAFDRLRAGSVGDSSERNELWKLAEWLDGVQRHLDQAFGPDDQRRRRTFAMARAATAVWVALAADPLYAALECLYEAYHAGVELEMLRSVVTTA